MSLLALFEVATPLLSVRLMLHLARSRLLRGSGEAPAGSFFRAQRAPVLRHGTDDALAQTIENAVARSSLVTWLALCAFGRHPVGSVLAGVGLLLVSGARLFRFLRTAHDTVNVLERVDSIEVAGIAFLLSLVMDGVGVAFVAACLTRVGLHAPFGAYLVVLYGVAQWAATTLVAAALRSGSPGSQRADRREPESSFRVT